MTNDATKVVSLLNQVEQHERSMRRRAVTAALVPLIAGAVVFAVVAWQVQQKSRELNSVTDKLTAASSELMTANEELATVREQLSRTQIDAERAFADLAATRGQLERTTLDLTETRKQFDEVTKDLAATREQLDQTRKDLRATQLRVDELQKELDKLQEELQVATEQLKLASDFDKYRFPGDWALSLKYTASRMPTRFGILRTIVELESTPWRLGGQSPKEGFDSPGFAAYVLEQNGLLTVPAKEARSRLRSLLQPKETPQVGDLVFYEAGYTMFYYLDEQQRPFVIGMTPLGVLALSPDFARKIAVGSVY